MVDCGQSREHLLDFVYGLLDDAEQQALRAHLADCPTCQAALAEVQRQQRLFARAARPVSSVREFVAPEEIRVAPAPAPVTTPAPAPRRRFVRPGLAWAAAAAVLLAVIGAWGAYERGRGAYEEQVAAARQHLQEIEAAEARLGAEPAAAAAAAQDAAGTALQLHVLGPAQVQPGARAVLQVTTRDADGRPAAGEVVARLLAPAAEQILAEATVGTTGTARVELPALVQAAGRSARLVVEAHTAGARARVEETVAVSTPALVAQLAADRTLCQPGDSLSFRALALDRYGLTPPAAPVPVRAELVDPAGKTVAHAEGKTDPAGVFAGKLHVGDTALAGNYTLRLRPDAPDVPLEPQTQPLEVVREPAPELQLDKEQYRPGDTVNALVTGPRVTENLRPYVTVNEQSVAVNQFGRVNNAPLAGAGGQNAAQQAQMFQLGAQQPGVQLQFALPKNLGGKVANVQVQLDDGKRRDTVNRNIPLGPPQLAVEFFPEGGDLVAGVANRVYYEVHSSAGGQDALDGTLTLAFGRGQVQSAFRQGRGALAFTPAAAETYVARVQAGGANVSVPDPFGKLGIREDGLVLHVPESVGKEGEPIGVRLRNPGAARHVLLTAECRGQLVEERWLEARIGETPVELRPAEGARGVLRVTAYTAQGGVWQPLAERLVYRAPARQLRLEVRSAPDQAAPRPGQAVQWEVEARNERGEPAPAWALAYVADEQQRPRESDPASRFYFPPGLHAPPDLADATLLTPDAPEARQQLDLFLGTHGWRRFTRAAPALARVSGGAAAVTVPALFSRENASLADLRRQVRERADGEIARLRAESARRRGALDQDRQAALQAVALARSALEAYEQRPREYLRLGLGLLLCGLLVTSLVLLGIGLARVLRRAPTARAALAGACVCLLVGAGLTAALLAPGTPEAPPAHKAEMARAPVAASAAKAVQEQRRLQALAEAPLADALPPPGKLAGAAREPVAQLSERREAAPADAGTFRLEQAATAPARPLGRGPAEPQRGASLPQAAPAQTRARGAPGSAPATATPAPAAPSGPAGAPLALGKKAAPAGAAGGAASADRAGLAKAAEPLALRREYSARRAAGSSQGTLLWLPALRLEPGTTALSFDVPARAAGYRVYLLGHTADGRLGTYEARFDVPGPP